MDQGGVFFCVLLSSRYCLGVVRCAICVVHLIESNLLIIYLSLCKPNVDPSTIVCVCVSEVDGRVRVGHRADTTTTTTTTREAYAMVMRWLHLRVSRVRVRVRVGFVDAYLHPAQPKR